MKKEYLIIVLILVYFLYIREPEVIYKEQESSLIFVEVKGEVLNQGVFQVQSNKRVIDVIELAGGFTDNADVLEINLSTRLTDEMVIIVYEKEDKSHNKININTASVSELMTLPGLGAKKAELIVKHREDSGRYRTIEEVMDVSGIGQSIFDSIKDFISTK